jgi:sugar/nucleoside kinase (ribokinase family)
VEVASFHKDLDRRYLKEIIVDQPCPKPEVVAFGTVALDVYGRLKALPAADEVAYVEEVGRYAGGMGANVAIALSRLKVPVSFVGKVGTDAYGRELLKALHQNNVDLSAVHLTDGPSLQTLVLRGDGDQRWLFAIGAKASAISISSPEEVSWDIVRDSRIIYLGEVFLEVASTIADFARTKKKIVVYRPGIPYMEYGVEKIRGVLEHTTTFILSQVAWKKLQENSAQKLATPNDLLKYGPQTVILTMGNAGCKVFSIGQTPRQFPVPASLKSQHAPIDPTGAGDGFSAGYMKGLLNSWRLEKAITYGQIVATITCSRMGASPAFPTEEEVETAKRQSNLSSLFQ